MLNSYDGQSLIWYYRPSVLKLCGIKFRFREETTMAEKNEKKLTDVNEFIASVNKKNKNHNGKAIQFAFVNKKRKH